MVRVSTFKFYILTYSGSNLPLSNFRLVNWSGLVLNLATEAISSDVELESMEETHIKKRTYNLNL